MKAWIPTGLVLLFFNALPALADDSPRHQIVDGVSIYLGIMPTAMIREHPDNHMSGAAHGGLPAGREYHHILIALFDTQTDQRLVPASIDAEISGLGGMAAQFKKLEPMHVERTISYGNYFRFPGRGIYRLHFSIRMTGLDHPVEAEFIYEHPGN